MQYYFVAKLNNRSKIENHSKGMNRLILNFKSEMNS